MYILYIKANVVFVCLSVCLCVHHRHLPTGPASGMQQQLVDLWPHMVVQEANPRSA